MVTSFLYGPLSKISELNELGNELYKIIQDAVPYLVTEIESCKLTSDNPFEYMENILHF